MRTLIEPLENRQLLSATSSTVEAAQTAALVARPRAVQPNLVGTYTGTFRVFRSSGVGALSRGTVRDARMSILTQITPAGSDANKQNLTGTVTIAGIGTLDLVGSITGKRFKFTLEVPATGEDVGRLTGQRRSASGSRLTARFALDTDTLDTVGKLVLRRALQLTFPITTTDSSGVLQSLPGGGFGSTGVGTNVFGSTLAGSMPTGFLDSQAFAPGFTPGFSSTFGTFGFNAIGTPIISPTTFNTFTPVSGGFNPATVAATGGGTPLVDFSGNGSGFVTGAAAPPTTFGTSSIAF